MKLQTISVGLTSGLLRASVFTHTGWIKLPCLTVETFAEVTELIHRENFEDITKSGNKEPLRVKYWSAQWIYSDGFCSKFPQFEPSTSINGHLTASAKRVTKYFRKVNKTLYFIFYFKQENCYVLYQGIG